MVPKFSYGKLKDQAARFLHLHILAAFTEQPGDYCCRRRQLFRIRMQAGPRVDCAAHRSEKFTAGDAEDRRGIGTY